MNNFLNLKLADTNEENHASDFLEQVEDFYAFLPMALTFS